ncbi:MAG: alpha/beta hydrolase family protein [Gemmatimonadales bacterium]
MHGETIERAGPYRSAVRWADELRASLLLLHGGEDDQVSPSQSLALAQRLEELDRSYELHIVAGESHSMGGYFRARGSLVVAWFRKHLDADGDYRDG